MNPFTDIDLGASSPAAGDQQEERQETTLKNSGEASNKWSAFDFRARRADLAGQKSDQPQKSRGKGAQKKGVQKSGSGRRSRRGQTRDAPVKEEEAAEAEVSSLVLESSVAMHVDDASPKDDASLKVDASPKGTRDPSPEPDFGFDDLELSESAMEVVPPKEIQEVHP